MTMPVNPFHTLYLTEGVGEFDFPSLFSPVLVPFVADLFQPSNVLLKGMQGTGKSMLLSLLDSKVRLQFWKHDRESSGSRISMGDPLQQLNVQHRRFIGASINLSNSKALQLSELIISKDSAENDQLIGAYFSDFLNCALLRDLLGSVQLLVTQLSEVGDQYRLDELHLSGDMQRFENAAQKLTDHPTCDFLRGCDSVSAMRAALERRLQEYRRRINSHKYVMSELIDRTRSSLGEPLDAAAQVFRSEGIIGSDTQVFVTIDQFETLNRLAQSGIDRVTHRSECFIQRIEDAINSRNRHIYYRIGTRPSGKLKRCEAARDYVEFDLDRVFQRQEVDHERILFHRFLEDAFRRRLATTSLPRFNQLVESTRPLEFAFGTTLTLSEQGELNAPKDRRQIIKLDESFPDEVVDYLRERAIVDPVTARLGEAWVRQQVDRIRRKKKPTSDEKALARSEVLNVEQWKATQAPWLDESKQWWRKERMAVAVLQLAGANAQRCRYSGEMAIVQLSGENVLAFLWICREIWERSARFHALEADAVSQAYEFPFSRDRQTEGILEASNLWHRKIESSPGNGHTILRFMDSLGRRLHAQLNGDRQMSYPGANGISLTKRDYEADPELKRLLDDATAECFLLQRPHTPKHTSRGESIKWYPHPILAPYYELTLPHTKEPLYLSGAKLRSWLEADGVLSTKSGSQPVIETLAVTKKPTTSGLRQRNFNFDNTDRGAE